MIEGIFDVFNVMTQFSSNNGNDIKSHFNRTSDVLDKMI